MPFLRPLLIVSLVLLGVPSVLRAQDDLVDQWWIQFENARKRGKDLRTLQFGELLIKEDPQDKEVLDGLIDAAQNSGSYGKALEYSGRLLSLTDDPATQVRHGEHLRRAGRYADAERHLKALIEGDALSEWQSLDAHRVLAEWHREDGRTDDARAVYEAIIAQGKNRVLKHPRELVAYAAACRFVGGRGAIRQAEKDLVTAQKLAQTAHESGQSSDPLPSLQLGWLYLDRLYLPGDAVEEFKAALEMRPDLVDAWWGLYRANDVWQKGSEAEEALKATLRVNSHYVPALVTRAASDVGDLNLVQARPRLRRAEEVQPDHGGVRTIKALVRWFEGDRVGFEADLEQLFKDRPTYSEGHLLIASVLNERRRWDEALDHMRRAVELYPTDPVLWDTFARFAFFLGLEADGLAALKKADALDSFSHPWRTNMFEVMRVLKAYYLDAISAHFHHRFHRKEEAFLRESVVDFCERSYAILSKKYQFVPPGVPGEPGRILVEWFRDHQGFSVRTLGMTHLGATGVCFGPFICMDSPGSRDPGEFSWARTFHHELAHTMTLGLSKGRVPRWLTEGLSTMEEIAYDPSWDRGLYRELHAAWATQDLLKVLEFDAAFRTPRIAFAYFQGGLVCRYMEETFGFDQVLAMVRAYSGDLTTDQILRTVLKTTPQAFDDGFSEWVGKLLKDVRLMPVLSPATFERARARRTEVPTDGENLLRLAHALVSAQQIQDALEVLGEVPEALRTDGRYAFIRGLLERVRGRSAQAVAAFSQAHQQGLKDHDLSLLLAVQAEKDGRADEARTFYEEALRHFPFASGPGDPRLKLAELADDETQRVGYLEAHLRTTYENLKVRDQLISHYRESGNAQEELRHLNHKVFIYPLESALHERLVALAVQLKDHGLAVRHQRTVLQIFLALPEEQRVATKEIELTLELARLLSEDGATESLALPFLERVLALDPNQSDAAQLLSQLKARQVGGPPR
jgi:tetratricopeptide (TPR) repeat protein